MPKIKKLKKFKKICAYCGKPIYNNKLHVYILDEDYHCKCYFKTLREEMGIK